MRTQIVQLEEQVRQRELEGGRRVRGVCPERVLVRAGVEQGQDLARGRHVVALVRAQRLRRRQPRDC